MVFHLLGRSSFISRFAFAFLAAVPADTAPSEQKETHPEQTRAGPAAGAASWRPGGPQQCEQPGAPRRAPSSCTPAATQSAAPACALACLLCAVACKEGGPWCEPPGKLQTSSLEPRLGQMSWLKVFNIVELVA